eukprot:Skav219648  [mRNA]  locus=scaffold628:358943:361451:- [translate_table: standard]
MAHPRSSEIAMLMAEHARWAQRDALKALYLAASDSNQASEAAQRANAAVMQAMRQPNSSFPVYDEKPLPMEPWLTRSPADHAIGKFCSWSSLGKVGSVVPTSSTSSSC